MKIDGRCHCGFITYEAEVDPEEVYICGCTDCQAISGTAFRWAVPVPEGSFKLLTGKPKTYIKTADSGATSHQLFCPQCASPLYSTSITCSNGVRRHASAPHNPPYRLPSRLAVLGSGIDRLLDSTLDEFWSEGH